MPRKGFKMKSEVRVLDDYTLGLAHELSKVSLTAKRVCRARCVTRARARMNKKK